MVVSVTGPRAVNELGGPVTPGIFLHGFSYNQLAFLTQCFSGSQTVCYIVYQISDLSNQK